MKTSIIYIWFNKRGDGLPEHFSNSNVYMTILRGTSFSIGLDDQEVERIFRHIMLKIPVNTKMNVKNLHDGKL